MAVFCIKPCSVYMEKNIKMTGFFCGNMRK